MCLAFISNRPPYVFGLELFTHIYLKWISIGVYLYSLLFFSYYTFFICGYHEVHIYRPIIIFTCFKLILILFKYILKALNFYTHPVFFVFMSYFTSLYLSHGLRIPTEVSYYLSCFQESAQKVGNEHQWGFRENLNKVQTMPNTATVIFISWNSPKVSLLLLLFKSNSAVFTFAFENSLPLQPILTFSNHSHTHLPPALSFLILTLLCSLHKKAHFFLSF